MVDDVPRMTPSSRLEAEPLANDFTKRTHRGLRFAKLRNEPKTRNSRRLEKRFGIWPIFARARATGGMRRSDVMGNIGEIPR
jgi:hypothetical protein